jgi:hypothetical protein
MKVALAFPTQTVVLNDQREPTQTLIQPSGATHS